LFKTLILSLLLLTCSVEASILSLDRAQIIDQRGNPIVNATIYIGEGSRDPEIFPKIAYADQDRTSQLGSELTTDAYGRFPKAYIEPPYSYRIRLQDGSQFDEQLFSFGIVEIDYSPGGTGTEAINVGAGGGGTPAAGSIDQTMLDAQITGLLAQIGINSTDIAQETTDRSDALTAEAAARAAEIQAASDATQANVDALSQSVTANQDDITAQNVRIVAVESNVLDVYGDGSNVGLTSFATDQQATTAAVENATTGLNATRTLAVTTESRLDDAAGDSSGKTLQRLKSMMRT